MRRHPDRRNAVVYAALPGVTRPVKRRLWISLKNLHKEGFAPWNCTFRTFSVQPAHVLNEVFAVNCCQVYRFYRGGFLRVIWHIIFRLFRVCGRGNVVAYPRRNAGVQGHAPRCSDGIAALQDVHGSSDLSAIRALKRNRPEPFGSGLIAKKFRRTPSSIREVRSRRSLRQPCRKPCRIASGYVQTFGTPRVEKISKWSGKSSGILS